MLSDLKVAKLKYKPTRSNGDANPGKLLLNRHPDRDGLYLAISPPHKDAPQSGYGSKTWRFDFRFPPSARGQRQCLTYGKYPDLSLAMAREKHLAARRALAEGRNPAEEKRTAKTQAIASLSNTYEAVSASWFESAKKGKSESWAVNNSRWSATANKVIGRKPLANISSDDVFAILREVEANGYAWSAERVRCQVAAVFSHAIRKRLYAGANPADALRGEIKVPDAKNNPFLRESELPDFLKTVDGSDADDNTKAAARVLLHTFTRKMELLAARWSEVDLVGATWEIPAERMKNGIAHLVPLSRQVVEEFSKLKAKAKGEFIFPNPRRPGVCMGRSTLNNLIEKLGYTGRLSPHGLRSIASTALNQSGFRGDVIERQLSHVEKNQVRASYNKADYWPDRVRMMQFWSDRIDQLCSGEVANVIPLQAKAAA